jgi:hypothetical protein
MKKSILIISLVAILCAIAGLGIYQMTNKNKDVPIVQLTKKAIATEVKTTSDAIKTLTTQKVNLQKELITSKASISNLQKVNALTSAKLFTVSHQIKIAPIQNTEQSNKELLCDSLADICNNYAFEVAEKDSLYQHQSNIYDSIICINETTIDKLKTENQFLFYQTDTLLNQLNVSTKANQHLQSKLNVAKSTNKIMCGSLLAIGGYGLMTRIKFAN